MPTDPSRATAVLYRRHGATVYRYAWHMLSSREDAEDATQATFLSVHTALSGSTPVREPQAWVLKIARNECLARIAARMRRPLTASLDDERVADVLAPTPSVPRAVELRSDLAAASDALGRLPMSQREAYVLREWLGLTTAEVAMSLGTSVAAADALLSRARRELVRALGGADESGAAGCVRTCEALADGAVDRATRAHLVRCRSCRAVRRALRPQLVVARSLIPSAALAERLGDSLPGFAAAGSGSAVAGSAAVGGGGLAAVVAKLTAGPAALKGAAAVAAAVAAVGGGVAIESGAVSGGPQVARAAAAPVVVATAPTQVRGGDAVAAVAKPKRVTPVGDDMRGDGVTTTKARAAGASSGFVSSDRTAFRGDAARPDKGSSGSGKRQSGDGGDHSGSGSSKGDSGGYHRKDSGKGGDGDRSRSDRHKKRDGGKGSSDHDGDRVDSGSTSKGAARDSSGKDSSGKGERDDDQSDSDETRPAEPAAS